MRKIGFTLLIIMLFTPFYIFADEMSSETQIIGPEFISKLKTGSVSHSYELFIDDKKVEDAKFSVEGELPKGITFNQGFLTVSNEANIGDVITIKADIGELAKTITIVNEVDASLSLSENSVENGESVTAIVQGLNLNNAIGIEITLEYEQTYLEFTQAKQILQEML